MSAKRGAHLRAVERVPSVAARVAQQLLDAIRDGGFAVGERLPTEHQLAAQLGVSRPSIREALTALQFAGHVESRRGVGTVVVSREPSLPGAARDRALAGADDVIDLLEARLVLEPQILAVAASDPDPPALRTAETVIQGMRLVAVEDELYAETDLRVHTALIDVCRNRFLVREGRRLLDAAYGPQWEDARRHAWSDRELVCRWTDHHERIWLAISEGDAAGAERVSHEHLLSVVDNALRWGGFAARDRPRLHALLQRAAQDASAASPINRGHEADAG